MACVRFSGLFGSLHHSFVAWIILIFGWYYFFHDLYSCEKNHLLIAQFYSFKKNVLQNIFNFSFLHKLNLNAKVIILPRPHHLLFWWWGFREDLMFFHLLFVEWLHFVEGLSLVIWFIFSLGKFVSSCSSYDLYSCLGNLYHFARRMIYIFIGRICIICSLYDLYSHWENLYHFSCRMIYISAWGICIICCWKDSLTLCRFGPCWGHVDICIK